MTCPSARTLAALACALAAASAFAQTYPTRPIKMLVPFAAGGTVDIVARLLGAKLVEEMGQPFVVENKGGAGGTAGRAPPAPGRRGAGPGGAPASRGRRRAGRRRGGAWGRVRG